MGEPAQFDWMGDRIAELERECDLLRSQRDEARFLLKAWMVSRDKGTTPPWARTALWRGWPEGATYVPDLSEGGTP